MDGDRLGRAATRTGTRGAGGAVVARQGDVLLVPVAELPAGCESVEGVGWTAGAGGGRGDGSRACGGGQRAAG